MELTALLAAVLLGLALARIGLIVAAWMRKRRALVRIPHAKEDHFLLGHTTPIRNPGKVHDYFLELAHEYGGVVYLRLGVQQFVLVSDPAAIAKLLSREMDSDKDESYLAMTKVCCTGWWGACCSARPACPALQVGPQALLA